jgi:parallel beta-helix repeat protein
MKRPFFEMTLTMLALVFFVLGALIVVDVQPAKSSPSTITVPDDYPTIQAAVNAASPRDTVYVKSAVYFENVVVNKTLSLVGQDSATTIIDGSGIGDVVRATVEGINITGFTVRNSQAGRPNAGIDLEQSNYSNIDRNVLANNWFGVYLNQCYDCNVVGNNATSNNGTGILLEYGSENNNVTRNEVSGSNSGILLDSSDYNNIAENNLTNNVEGIVIYEISLYNTVVENGITRSIDDALSIGDSSYNSLVENTVTASGNGIVLKSSSPYNNVTGNNVTANSNGIVLDSSSNHNTFLQNDLVGNAQQVVTGGSTNIWDNGSRGNYWSDYLTKYSNASETDNSGFWNKPYAIDANNFDHYPLVNQTTIPEFPPPYFLLACMLACFTAIITFNRKHLQSKRQQKNTKTPLNSLVERCTEK